MLSAVTSHLIILWWRSRREKENPVGFTNLLYVIKSFGISHNILVSSHLQILLNTHPTLKGKKYPRKAVFEVQTVTFKNQSLWRLLLYVLSSQFNNKNLFVSVMNQYDMFKIIIFQRSPVFNKLERHSSLKQLLLVRLSVLLVLLGG